jgi:predicted ATPase/DNA-binding CsgD family transcriptional regulator
LGVDGETAWRVPSLSLPGLEAEASNRDLGGSDAVSLFVERAGKARPGFALGGENAESVAGVCRELDGLPLAIELAAARLRMLTVEQIGAGLANRFRLLTGGPRTAMPRLQTLRASVDWSYELLSEHERVLLRRLGVFAGGFTLEAVEEVCAGEGVEREQLLDVLGSLVDQSLVIAEEHGSAERYGLLETVRQYALERLAVAGEEEALRGHHRDFFLKLAEQAGPQLETGHQLEWVARLDPEAANLAAAIDHALKTDSALALRLCTALYRLWCARGRFAEAELADARALDACADSEPGLRARVLYGRAYTAIWAGNYKAAEAHATEALALADGVGDDGTAARARCQLGTALLFTNPRAARTELARAAELALAASDDWALVTAGQITAATYIFESNHVQGARANDEVAALAERQGDPFQLARRWLWVASIAEADGRFEDACEALERVRAAVDATGDPVHEALADAWTARVDIRQGQTERALERLHGRLERTLKLGAAAAHWLLFGIAFAELAVSRPELARDRLEGLVPLIDGLDGLATSWALALLADARSLLGDDDAEATALQAQASGERLGNRLVATRARLTLGRLAAGHGDWTAAQQHVLAHLDACAEGGHASYVPDCLDALGEVTAGLGSEGDAVRLFAAAERARAEIGVVRFPPREEHWATIDGQLREALGEDAYQQAWTEGTQLTVDDALEWARRARGPRRRPPSGWGSLTPTERRVAELLAEGLTNTQVAERMFVSAATVKTHVAHIFKKLDVHNRTELAALVARKSAGG